MSQNPQNSKKDEVDEDLAQLLDSALEDFTTVPQALSKKAEGSSQEEKKEQSVAKKEESSDKAEPVEPVDDAEWSEDFIRQAAEEFEQNLANLLQANGGAGALSAEELQGKFQQIASAAQQVIQNPEVDETSTNFAASISQTLQGLQQSSSNPQEPFGEQDLMNMFAGNGDQGNAFLPFMQGMMQSLLSKEVLYPSLKDILDKFPDWLRTNDARLSEEEKGKYSAQMKLMQDVCTELEGESQSDSVQAKQDRFEKVLGLMQKLQDLGQPPADLVGDGGGLPDLESGQCCVM